MSRDHRAADHTLARNLDAIAVRVDAVWERIRLGPVTAIVPARLELENIAGTLRAVARAVLAEQASTRTAPLCPGCWQLLDDGSTGPQVRAHGGPWWHHRCAATAPNALIKERQEEEQGSTPASSPAAGDETAAAALQLVDELLSPWTPGTNVYLWPPGRKVYPGRAAIAAPYIDVDVVERWQARRAELAQEAGHA